MAKFQTDTMQPGRWIVEISSYQHEIAQCKKDQLMQHWGEQMMLTHFANQLPKARPLVYQIRVPEVL